MCCSCKYYTSETWDRQGTAKNPIDMGARADCRRAAARVSDSSVQKQKQVNFMLPGTGDDSPTNGDAFASARAKQEAGEHGSHRTTMPKWQWQGGAVKWANSTASAKCWVQCKHGAVCVQGIEERARFGCARARAVFTCARVSAQMRARARKRARISSIPVQEMHIRKRQV